MNYPFIKFYCRDWMSDQQLRMCSLAGRGLWFEFLCIMHNAPRYGYLVSHSGKPLSDHELSRLTGADTDELKTLKRELIEHGIPSIEPETGTWFNRRMTKDQSKRDKCAIAGRNGGGNPALSSHSSPKKEERYQIPDTRDHISLNTTIKGDLYRSDAPTAKATKAEASPDGDVVVLPFDSKEFKEAWKHFLEHRRKLRKTMSSHAQRLSLGKLAGLNESEAIKWIENAIEMGWVGIFEPKTYANTQKGKQYDHSIS